MGIWGTDIVPHNNFSGSDKSDKLRHLRLDSFMDTTVFLNPVLESDFTHQFVMTTFYGFKRPQNPEHSDKCLYVALGGKFVPDLRMKNFDRNGDS
jgi:hypothetical protein